MGSCPFQQDHKTSMPDMIQGVPLNREHSALSPLPLNQAHR